jgi:hypothetical protein
MPLHRALADEGRRHDHGLEMYMSSLVTSAWLPPKPASMSCATCCAFMPAPEIVTSIRGIIRV